MTIHKPAIETYSGTDELAEAACRRVLALAEQAIADHGRFVLSLAGGSTPEKLYRLLADSHADWSRWHLVYGDERLLPIGHPDRNSSMVEKQWLKHVHFPIDNHHEVFARDTVEQTAADYGQLIKPLLPIDLALLGIGEDGHTASLFPGQPVCTEIVCPIEDAPKPPPERISLSYRTLSEANDVCFLAVGESKRKALTEGINGKDLPFAKVHGRRHTWLMTDMDLDTPQ